VAEWANEGRQSPLKSLAWGFWQSEDGCSLRTTLNLHPGWVWYNVAADSHLVSLKRRESDESMLGVGGKVGRANLED
jgi:hypothetical protein